MIIRAQRIYTADEKQPVATEMAIRNGRILAIGKDVSQYAGSATRTYDLRNHVVLPGLIDSHAHMAGLGRNLEELDFRQTKSEAEIVAMVSEAAKKTPPGAWIRGRNWDQTRWKENAFPALEALSRAAPEHPVVLTRVDGHAIWVNRKALQIAKITRDTKDPDGGRIVRDEQGQPTGVLIDRAEDLVHRHVPSPTPAAIERYLERAARECTRLGITGVHDAGVDGVTLAAYRRLIAARKLPVRINAMIGGPGALWHEYLKKGPETGEFLTVRSIKMFADGALGSRGAALLEPYSDDPHNRGLLIAGREELEQVARDAYARGFQVNTHAIGDRGNRTVLEAYGTVLQGSNDKRFRIEHAQVVAPEDFELFEKYSVIAAMQPTHATSDMRWAAERLGTRRVKGAYAWRSMLARGIHLPSGSDFPVEEPNPLEGFYAAVTRQDRSGWPAGGWDSEQRMSREETLRSWTWEGAYAAFEESEKGSLMQGKRADFIVVSHDIMQVPAPEILKARVLMTVLGGEVVYSELR